MTQNAAHNLHNCESLMPPKLLIQNTGETLSMISVTMYTSNTNDQHAYNRYVTMCRHYSIDGEGCFCWSSKMKFCGVTAQYVIV